MNLGEVTDATIQAGGAIGSVRVKNWLAGQLTAGSIGRLAVTGNFGADVTVTGDGVATGKSVLRSVTVGGAIGGSTIAVAGTVSSFTAGAFVDSALLAGFTPTDPANPFAGGTFVPGALVNNFQVTGIKGSTDPAFANSTVVASTLGTVRLKSVATDNGGNNFGLLVDVAVKRLTVGTPILALRNVTADPILPGAFGDFQLRVI